MSRTAALASSWFWQRNTPGPVQGASTPGVPFMTNQLGLDARLIVEFAWGANLTASPDTWSWTDVTTDVQQAGDQKIAIQIGKSDEASKAQPAKCSFQLDNRMGLYSLGGQSPNWPNVRENTPTRCRVDLGSGPVVLFQGVADGFTPGWDVTGKNAIVKVSASGRLRQLNKGAKPVDSPLRRAVIADYPNNIVAYWPCEDGENSTSIASGVGGPAMSIVNPSGVGSPFPIFADSTDFVCSQALPKLNGSAWVGSIQAFTATGSLEMRCLISFPSSGTPTGALIAMRTNGTAFYWQLAYISNNINLLGLATDGTFVYFGDVGIPVDGKSGQLGLKLVQNGSDINWTVDFLPVGATSPTSVSGVSTFSGYTIGAGTRISVNYAQFQTDVVLGHISVAKNTTSATDRIASLNAYVGELMTDRIARLCSQTSVPINIIGTSTTTMGQQQTGTLLDSLTECETADQGILYDGLGPGLTYITRAQLEDAATSLVINAAADYVGEFQPVHDDQRITNLVKATRKNGSSYTYEMVTGSLGTDAIGNYDSSITINIDTDSPLPHYAAWLVHIGTVEEYRYPTLGMNLAAAPTLIYGWLATQVGGRIDVTNIQNVRTQHPAGTLSSMLEGYTQEIGQFLWTVTANCAPYDTWRVAQVVASNTVTNEFEGRVDATTCSLATGAAAGATTLSVATTVGPLWTTDVNDLPFDVKLGGLRVSISAISGAGSPQTFTVDPAGLQVTVPQPPGTSVSLWAPEVVGL